MVNRVYRAVPILVESVVLPADLIDLPFQEFYLNLGMDWLSMHHAVVDCYSKTVVFKLSDKEVTIRGEKGYGPSNLVSAAKIERYIRKGYEA